MAGESETALFRAQLVGPQLEDGWKWVRGDTERWRFGESGLELATKPGALPGQDSTEALAPALLLRPVDDANACEVTLTMPAFSGPVGEQAGLFWYSSDDNYVKLVVEWLQDRAASITLARRQAGEFVVCGKADLDEEEAQEPTRLRLEMSADGTQLSGCVVGSYYTRLIGSCQADTATWGDNATLSFGMGAYGGPDDASAKRFATFSNFAAIFVKPNRVQWADAAATVPQAFASPSVQPLASPVQDGNEFPAPGGGLVLSDDLTDEQRRQIAAMLGQANFLPAGDQES